MDGQSEMSSLVEVRNNYKNICTLMADFNDLCLQSLRKEKEEVESNLFNKLSKKDTQVEELDSIVVELKSQIEV